MKKLGIEPGKEIGFSRVKRFIDPDNNELIFEGPPENFVYIFREDDETNCFAG